MWYSQFQGKHTLTYTSLQNSWLHVCHELLLWLTQGKTKVGMHKFIWGGFWAIMRGHCRRMCSCCFFILPPPSFLTRGPTVGDVFGENISQKTCFFPLWLCFLVSQSCGGDLIAFFSLHILAAPHLLADQIVWGKWNACILLTLDGEKHADCRKRRLNTPSGIRLLFVFLGFSRPGEIRLEKKMENERGRGTIGLARFQWHYVNK